MIQSSPKRRGVDKRKKINNILNKWNILRPMFMEQSSQPVLF